MNPPLRAEEDRRGAPRGSSRRHDRGDRDRPRAARAPREGGAVRGGAVRRHRPRDGVRRPLHAARRARPAAARDAARAHERGPGARSSASSRRGSRSARAANLVLLDLGRRLARRRGRLPLEVGQLVAPRRDAARPGACDGRRRQGSRSRHERTSSLLEDGTVFPGALRRRAEGVAFGEAVFTTAMSGYQEVVNRPELRRATRLLHGADDRELRRRARARASPARAHARAVLMRRAGGAAWTSWLAERCVVALEEIDTRSLVIHLRARGRHARPLPSAARRTRRLCSPRSARSRSWRGAPSWRPSRRASPAPSGGPAPGSASSTTGASARSSRGSTRPESAVTVWPHDTDAAHDPRLAPGRRPALERARRPCCAPSRGRRRPGASRQGAASSGSASGTSCSRSPPGSRRSSFRSATAARTIPCSSARSGRVARHVPEPRLRGSRRGSGGDPRVALRRHRRGSRPASPSGPAPVQFHPEAGPGPHDAWPILERWVEGARLAAAA